jgi:hypothetical protein
MNGVARLSQVDASSPSPGQRHKCSPPDEPAEICMLKIPNTALLAVVLVVEGVTRARVWK